MVSLNISSKTNVMKLLQRMVNIGLLIFLSCFTLVGQQETAKVTFFSSDDAPFYVYLNTIQQNQKAQPEVTITEAPAETYKVRFEFTKDNVLPVERSIHFKAGKVSEYKLVKRREAKDKGKSNNKGHMAKYTLKLVSLQAIDDAQDKDDHGDGSADNDNDDNDDNTSDTDDDADSDDSHSSADNDDQEDHHQSHGTHSGHHGTHESVSISIKVNKGHHGHHSGHHAGDQSSTSENPDDEADDNSSSSSSTTVSQESSPLPDYNGKIGCSSPMSPSEFADAKTSISDKTFEDSKLQIAKQITRSKCMLSRQVKEVMQLFSYESTRLEYAKMAHDYTHDVDNYYKVHDAFEYESSIEELNNYIN